MNKSEKSHKKVKQVAAWRKNNPEKLKKQRTRERLIKLCRINNILPNRDIKLTESEKKIMDNIINGIYSSSLDIPELNILKQEGKLETDFKRRIRKNIRKSFSRKGWSKSSETFNILKCDYETFKIWIQSKFKEGMSWKNMYEWDLDHQIPLSLANNEDEVIELCFYKNYQPLWKRENYSKQDKLIIEDISEENRNLFKKFIDRSNF